MNKVLIVGHPSSGYEDVEKILQHHGLSTAKPSRREGLSAQEITDSILKGHGAPSVTDVQTEDEYLAVQPGAIWHGMALDLMLGNIDQPLWGWADHKSIFLLDYWASLDPRLTFVLTYAEPQRALTGSTQQGGHADAVPDHERNIQNWVAYNSALLHFFLRHQERCILVHSRQVINAVESYLGRLQPLLETPLKHKQLQDTGTADACQNVLEAHQEKSQQSNASLMLRTNLAPALSTSGLDLEEVERLLNANEAEQFLVQGVLNDYPAAMQIYEEMQSAASLPFDGAPSSARNTTEAWQDFIRHRAFVTDLLAQIHALFKDKEKELSEKDEQLKKSEAIKSASEQETKIKEQRLKDLTEENELLLNQLHMVQEELERHYLKQQQPQKPSRSRYYGAADRVKQQLTYRLGARIIKQDQTFWGKIFLYPALLDEFLSFRRDLKARCKQKLPPISQFADAYEAENVKRHLSYRLGLVVKKCGWNPIKWILLPFSLLDAAKIWRQERNIDVG